MSLFEDILKARGLTGEKRDSFLRPQYENGHDPFKLPDMDKAVERLVVARERQDHITIYGDTKTGVSLMMIDEGMDTGKILTSRTLHISKAETSVTLTERLVKLSDDLLAEYTPRYIAGEVTPKNQPHPSRATYSRKLTKQDGTIDWTLPAEQIERNIRGYIEWPGSRTTINGLDIIITAAKVTDLQGKPGTHAVHGKELIIHAGKGALSIESLKPAGKKEMPVTAFLAGYSKNL